LARHRGQLAAEDRVGIGARDVDERDVLELFALFEVAKDADDGRDAAAPGNEQDRATSVIRVR